MLSREIELLEKLKELEVEILKHSWCCDVTDEFKREMISESIYLISIMNNSEIKSEVLEESDDSE